MSIRTDVMPTHLTPAALIPVIGAAMRQAFPDVDENGVDTAGIAWETQRDFRVLAWDDADWGSIVAINLREITVGGRAVRVAGIGSVMTVPSMRGRGMAKAAMRHAADFICYELNVDAGMLYCLPETIPFYGGLGWYELQRKIIYYQGDGGRVFDTRGHQDGAAMFLPCRDFVFPSGEIDINGKMW